MKVKRDGDGGGGGGGKKRKAAVGVVVTSGAHHAHHADDGGSRKRKKQKMPRDNIVAEPRRSPPSQREQRQPLIRPASDPADDCETPYEAYKHIAPLLQKLAQRLKKPKHELKIWDPYFCNGAVREHLASLGFPNVHNAGGENFYALIASDDTDGDGEGDVDGEGEVGRRRVVLYLYKQVCTPCQGSL